MCGSPFFLWLYVKCWGGILGEPALIFFKEDW